MRKQETISSQNFIENLIILINYWFKENWKNKD